MRIASILTWCVGLALLVGGCDTTDSRYFRYGIGTDLYSTDIVESTQLQDIYLTELCRQALPLVSTADTECLNASLGPNDWNVLVQAGFNDVDRRCDSYLAWLDDRRRSNDAFLKELGDITVASQAIMRVSGVSANPITLAGLAFGLAANTFTNINSRLLLEVDKTTVQTLVLHRRNDFRGQIQSIRVENKPAAIHALRSYLNICTPFVIETDINATITVFQSGGAAALDRRPLITAETVKSTVITSARNPLPPRDKLPPPPKQPFVTSVQMALCVPVVTGIVDKDTTAAVRTYLVTRRLKVPDPLDPTAATIRDKMQELIDNVPDCNSLNFMNAYEAARYGIPKGDREVRIKVLQSKMAGMLVTKNSTVTVPQNGTLDKDTRNAIEEIRKLFQQGSGRELDEPLNTLIQSSS